MALVVSLILLAVSIGYARDPQWRSFFVRYFANDFGGRHRHMVSGAPYGFKIAFDSFLLLNLPAAVFSLVVSFVVDHSLVVEGEARVVMVFVSLFVGSVGFWSGLLKLLRDQPAKSLVE